MRIIQKGRGEGKTEAMVEWLKESDDHVLIVTNVAERRRIIKQYFHSGLVSTEEFEDYKRRIVTASNRDRLRGRHFKLAIDNVDMILYDLFHHPIEQVTFTPELEEADEAK